MSMEIPVHTRKAVFSPCRQYRYVLRRAWNSDLPECMFIGLNPSTADETLDDPTIRRCIRYAFDWGYGGLLMTNLFAYRATDPNIMKAAADPVGAENNAYIKGYAIECGVVVAAWGTDGIHMNRASEVRQLLPQLHYLRLTKDGHPGHPLYLPKTLTPQLWSSDQNGGSES